MNKEDLEKLNRDELEGVICDFYNEIDRTFNENRHSSNPDHVVIMELYDNYINSSRKLLRKIK